MLRRTPIALLTMLVVTVAIVAACQNSGESVVSQPTALPPLGTITPITAEPSEPSGEPATATDEPANGGAVAVPVAFVRTCGVCHAVAGTDAVGSIGPELTHIGSVAATRTDLSAEDYIRQSIQEPTAFLAPDFAPLMPGGLVGILGDDFEAVVAYLMSLQ